MLINRIRPPGRNLDLHGTFTVRHRYGAAARLAKRYRRIISTKPWALIRIRGRRELSLKARFSSFLLIIHSAVVSGQENTWRGATARRGHESKKNTTRLSESWTTH